MEEEKQPAGGESRPVNGDVSREAAPVEQKQEALPPEPQSADVAPSQDGEIRDKRQDDNLAAVIESLLFAYEKPLTVEAIRKVLDSQDTGQIRKAVERLAAEYEGANRGMRIIEVAGGYKMISAPHFASFLRKLFKGPQNSDKLSNPAMETLAIIAYKQPLSKLEIESLRKVNADGVVATLLEKNLIRVTGRRDAPGRPKVYGTTREFLEYFGLKSIEDLPRMEHFPLSPDKQREILEKFAEGKNSPAGADEPSMEAKKNDIPQQPAQTN